MAPAAIIILLSSWVKQWKLRRSKVHKRKILSCIIFSLNRVCKKTWTAGPISRTQIQIEFHPTAKKTVHYVTSKTYETLQCLAQNHSTFGGPTYTITPLHHPWNDPGEATISSALSWQFLVTETLAWVVPPPHIAFMSSRRTQLNWFDCWSHLSLGFQYSACLKQAECEYAAAQLASQLRERCYKEQFQPQTVLKSWVHHPPPFLPSSHLYLSPQKPFLLLLSLFPKPSTTS